MAVNLSAGHIAAGSGQSNTVLQGNYEPQRQNNWYFEVDPPSQGDNDTKRVIELALDTGFLPVEQSDEIEVHFVNERVYIAGKPMYDAGSLVLKDYVDQAVMKAIADWRKTVYDPDTGKVGLAKDYKVGATIVLFAPDGTYARKWELSGCWPQQVTYGGTLDMSSSEINKIEITLRFDRARPVSLSSGPGQIA